MAGAPRRRALPSGLHAMSETAAISKFACPACGGQAVWNPAKQKLICPFCGTESPAKLDVTTGGIVEHDLAAALRGLA